MPMCLVVNLIVTCICVIVLSDESHRLLVI